MSHQKTISVDFDGVLHNDAKEKWVAPHVIGGIRFYKTMDSADPIAWLLDMSGHFDIVIHSMRCQTWRGRRAVRKWISSQIESYFLFQGYVNLSRSYTLHCLHAATCRKAAKIIAKSFIYTDRKQLAQLYVDDRAWHFKGQFPTYDEIKYYKPWHKPETEAEKAARTARDTDAW